jgi:hypothetical protein
MKSFFVAAPLWAALTFSSGHPPEGEIVIAEPARGRLFVDERCSTPLDTKAVVAEIVSFRSTCPAGECKLLHRKRIVIRGDGPIEMSERCSRSAQ